MEKAEKAKPDAKTSTEIRQLGGMVFSQTKSTRIPGSAHTATARMVIDNGCKFLKGSGTLEIDGKSHNINYPSIKDSFPTDILLIKVKTIPEYDMCEKVKNAPFECRELAMKHCDLKFVSANDPLATQSKDSIYSLRLPKASVYQRLFSDSKYWQTLNCEVTFTVNGDNYLYFDLGCVPNKPSIHLVVSWNTIVTKLIAAFTAEILACLLTKVATEQGSEVAIKAIGGLEVFVVSTAPLGTSAQMLNDSMFQDDIRDDMQDMDFYFDDFMKKRVILRNNPVQCLEKLKKNINVWYSPCPETFYGLARGAIMMKTFTRLKKDARGAIFDFGHFSAQTIVFRYDTVGNSFSITSAGTKPFGGIYFIQLFLREYCKQKKLNPMDLLWEGRDDSHAKRNYNVMLEFLRQWWVLETYKPCFMISTPAGVIEHVIDYGVMLDALTTTANSLINVVCKDLQIGFFFDDLKNSVRTLSLIGGLFKFLFPGTKISLRDAVLAEVIKRVNEPSCDVQLMESGDTDNMQSAVESISSELASSPTTSLFAGDSAPTLYKNLVCLTRKRDDGPTGRNCSILNGVFLNTLIGTLQRIEIKSDSKDFSDVHLMIETVISELSRENVEKTYKGMLSQKRFASVCKSEKVDLRTDYVALPMFQVMIPAAARKDVFLCVRMRSTFALEMYIDYVDASGESCSTAIKILNLCVPEIGSVHNGICTDFGAVLFPGKYSASYKFGIDKETIDDEVLEDVNTAYVNFDESPQSHQDAVGKQTMTTKSITSMDPTVLKKLAEQPKAKCVAEPKNVSADAPKKKRKREEEEPVVVADKSEKVTKKRRKETNVSAEKKTEKVSVPKPASAEKKTEIIPKKKARKTTEKAEIVAVPSPASVVPSPVSIVPTLASTESVAVPKPSSPKAISVPAERGHAPNSAPAENDEDDAAIERTLALRLMRMHQRREPDEAVECIPTQTAPQAQFQPDFAPETVVIRTANEIAATGSQPQDLVVDDDGARVGMNYGQNEVQHITFGSNIGFADFEDHDETPQTTIWTQPARDDNALEEVDMTNLEANVGLLQEDW